MLYAGAGLSKEAIAEAKERSSKLSTSSDVVGVKFNGAAFQCTYFETKFARRGKLLFDVIEGLMLSDSKFKSMMGAKTGISTCMYA
jgi:hypothetical protein